jgi:predicted DNA-binding transcriptional regulator AlpA
MTTAVLLTINEIAEIFRTSKAAIYARLCRARKGLDDFPLPCFGKGKRCYWTQISINDFFASKEREQSPSPQGKEKTLSDQTREALKRHRLG